MSCLFLDAGFLNKENKLDIELYDFQEHIGSVEWISAIPDGMISQQIDLRYSTVNITTLDDGYQIYVGPKDAYLGGEGIIILLDSDFKLKEYVVEKLEPAPQF
jgi:hypothetical protein